jgi:2-polyprenyl-6-hydroxyphenyl methylase/3-demethylubiquinone-9 3-methyltransferase
MIASKLQQKWRSKMWALAYDMYEDPTSQYFARILLRHITESIQARFGERELYILELGCGHGRISIPLAKLGHHVLAVDNNRVALNRAREHASKEGASVDFREADAMSENFGEYDILLAVELLEGRESEVLRFIRQVYGNILSGGLLILEFRSRYIQTLIALKNGDFDRAQVLGQGTNRFLEPADLERILMSNGYNIVKMVGIGIVSGAKFDELNVLPNPSKLDETQKAVLRNLELDFSSVKELSGCGRTILAIAGKRYAAEAANSLTN